MKSVEVRDEDHHLELDLGLSIGGAFRHLSHESAGAIPMNGSDCSSLTLDSDGDDAKNRGEIRRRQADMKRDEKRQNRGRVFLSVSDEEGRNRPKKKKLEGVGFGRDLVDHPAAEIPSYPYSSLQYVPFLNGYGYAFPCLVPYWAAGETTLHGPVACRNFDRSVSDVGFSNRKSGSYGSSPVCSSSAISENYHSSSSSSMNRVKKEEPIVMPFPSNKARKSDMKPPTPKPEIERSQEQMPLVSTTGVGPNGRKTITSGLLYRYWKMEVSILCLCHGESFSAAEFVKHAGGGEVSHPLRHITVLPSNGIIP